MVIYIRNSTFLNCKIFFKKRGGSTVVINSGHSYKINNLKKKEIETVIDFKSLLARVECIKNTRFVTF